MLGASSFWESCMMGEVLAGVLVLNLQGGELLDGVLVLDLQG